MRRMLTTLGTTVLLVLSPLAAYADDFPTPSFQDDPGMDPSAGMGVPGWFIALFVLIVVGGIATSVYRIASARRMATRAGMDPRGPLRPPTARPGSPAAAGPGW